MSGAQPVSRIRRPFVIAFIILCLALPGASGAQANQRYAAFVLDTNSNKVLFARNADAPRYPASITKVMTLFIMFEELEAGRLELDTPLKVSKAAAAEPPSKVWLRPGKTISVKDAMGLLLTKSANDVAHVVAENIAGSVPAFARRMTRTARSIGMSRTTFANPHGLPDRDNVSTARDLATLGLVTMRRFPEYFHYFSTRSYTYRGHTYGNHNRLLRQVAGVDGFKTGYIRASGFNLLASMKRGSRRIIAVVMGGRTGRSRDRHMKKLLLTYIEKASPDGMMLARLPFPPRRPERRVTTFYVPSTTVPGTMLAAADRLALGFRETPPARSAPLQIATNGAAVHGQGDADIASPSGSRGSGGWAVQIGAFDAKGQAQAALAEARRDAPGLLATAKAYTEPVEIDGRRFWRARFAGFDGGEAVHACSRLRQEAYGCFRARH